MSWGADDPVVDLPVKRRDEPGELEALGRGAVQGATLGFGDELWGGLRAIGDSLPAALGGDEGGAGLIDGWGERYRRNRDEVRSNNRAAEDAHGNYYLAGNVLGGLALPIPGGAARSGAMAGVKALRALGASRRAALMGGRLLSTTGIGAGLGSAAGLGASEADTFIGNLGDAARGGAFGAAGGLVAGGLGEGVRALNSRAGRGVASAKADAVAKKAAEAEKAHQSALGAERSMVQQASRDLEVLAREAAELPKGHPLQVAAEQKLASPEGMRLREMVLKGKLESTGDRLSQHAALVAERHAAKAAMDPAAVQAAAEQSLENPLRTQVLPRLKTYANRSIGPAIGGAVGGVPGAMLGTVVSNSVGRPGTAMANMQRSPAVRNALWGLIERATEAGPRAGAIVNPLQSPLRSAGARYLQMTEPSRRLRTLADALKEHPEDEEIAGY